MVAFGEYITTEWESHKNEMAKCKMQPWQNNKKGHQELQKNTHSIRAYKTFSFSERLLKRWITVEQVKFERLDFMPVTFSSFQIIGINNTLVNVLFMFYAPNSSIRSLKSVRGL